jgi:Uncharacterized conserved protein
LHSFDRDWQRWFPESRDKEPVSPAHRRGKASKVVLILVGVFILFIILSILKGFYTEWLWFSSLGYGSVYATILKTKVLIFFSAAIIFASCFGQSGASYAPDAQ